MNYCFMCGMETLGDNRCCFHCIRRINDELPNEVSQINMEVFFKKIEKGKLKLRNNTRVVHDKRLNISKSAMKKYKKLFVS